MAAAEDGFKDGNTLEATAKAAVAAWRSAQVIHPCALPFDSSSSLSLKSDHPVCTLPYAGLGSLR